MIHGKINDDTKTLSMIIAYVIVVHDIIDLKQKSRRKNSIEQIILYPFTYNMNAEEKFRNKEKLLFEQGLI